MIESRAGQRVVGVLLALLGGGLTAWTWHDVTTDGSYYPAMAILGPVFAVFGACLTVLPFDYDRLRAEHGVSRPEKWAHYPPAWKAVAVVALVAGFGHLLAIKMIYGW